MYILDNFELLIHLLLHNPRETNAAIARTVGCGRRRVRRYRRLLAASNLTAEDLAGCDAQTLNALFNMRTPVTTYAVPDFVALESALPDRSGRAHWRAYCAASGESSTLSYPQFMRCRAASHVGSIHHRQRNQRGETPTRQRAPANSKPYAHEARP